MAPVWAHSPGAVKQGALGDSGCKDAGVVCKLSPGQDGPGAGHSAMGKVRAHPHARTNVAVWIAGCASEETWDMVDMAVEWDAFSGAAGADTLSGSWILYASYVQEAMDRVAL